MTEQQQEKGSCRSLTRYPSLDDKRAAFLAGRYRKPGFIAFIYPSTERSKNAHAYARERGHELGPWMEPTLTYAQDLNCYYAKAVCVRCGAPFMLAWTDGGSYDGWAAHTDCGDKEGRSSIPQSLIPGPQPDAQWSTGRRLSLTEGLGVDDEHMALEAAS